MDGARQKWLTLLAVLGLSWWFFGNLYEAFVISPNWVVDAPAQLERLHGFFVRTSPTAYFVPVTPLAMLLAWALTFTNRRPEARRAYRIASVIGAAAMAVNALIVGTLITRLFGDAYRSFGEELSVLAWTWNGLNVVRMVLTASTAAFLFSAFRALDRADAARGASSA
jgi:hypothetical protein